MIDLTDISLGPCQVPTHTKTQAGRLHLEPRRVSGQTGAPPGETIGGLPRMPNQAGGPSITQYSCIQLSFQIVGFGKYGNGEMQQ